MAVEITGVDNISQGGCKEGRERNTEGTLGDACTVGQVPAGEAGSNS